MDWEKAGKLTMVFFELVVDILRVLRVGGWNLWCWIWYGSVILAPWISEV